ncbi:hypothetical protein [Halobiforma nitratireducens]|uniref:Uncharacterized protein n=1 Tax=Halobiforma nitratireducens JCM 10879 TaxID=1227454 RepID=M0MLN9_9EURY|nr:hypothetical protein [Halobiforma nitratireducens]EMA46561.1 hypothetical protein C446_01136 [Halobiforma nitratireducens JCM 10879]
MPSPPDSLSPLQRDLLIAALAVVLVTAPLWVGVFGLSEPGVSYERAEVVTDNDTIEFQGGPVHGSVPISEDVACSGSILYETRTCSFEAQLTDGETVPTGVRTSGTATHGFPYEEYRYVQVDDAVYETAYTVEEDPGDDMNQVHAALEHVDPDDVLESVSIAAEHSTLSEVVREALENGEAQTRGEVDVPETPIETDDGYYRVYQSGTTQPSQRDEAVRSLAWFGGPIVGLLLFYHLSGRITYADRVKQE